MTASATLTHPVDLLVCSATPAALTAAHGTRASAAAVAEDTQQFASAPTPTAPSAGEADTPAGTPAHAQWLARLRAELAAVLTELAELEHDEEMAERMVGGSSWKDEIIRNRNACRIRKRELYAQITAAQAGQPQ